MNLHSAISALTVMNFHHGQQPDRCLGPTAGNRDGSDAK